MNRLEDANYYILRSLLGYCKSILYQDLLRIINMKTLEHGREQQSLIYPPKYTKEFFKVRETQYNFRGNGVN